jgi:hypothetical protein
MTYRRLLIMDSLPEAALDNLLEAAHNGMTFQRLLGLG